MLWPLWREIKRKTHIYDFESSSSVWQRWKDEGCVDKVAIEIEDAMLAKSSRCVALPVASLAAL